MRYIRMLLFLVTLCVSYSSYATESTDSSDFVDISQIIPEAVIELRYYTQYNFIGDRIHGYEAPVAMLTKEAAYALKNANKELLNQGYTIKVYDAYRPQQAVDHFVIWARNLQDVRMKEYFYPEFNKDELFIRGYIAFKSGHSKGSTIDITLFDLSNKCEVDMGGTFDYFGYRSHQNFPYITEQQKKNRELLRQTMLKHGFMGIDTEWWHYTLISEPYPTTYFNFPVK